MECLVTLDVIRHDRKGYKVKITRKQLRHIINEAMKSIVRYKPGSDPRRKLHHAYQQHPIPPEQFADKEYRRKLSSMRKDSKGASRQADALAGMLGHDQPFGIKGKDYTDQKDEYDKLQKSIDYHAGYTKAYADLANALMSPIIYIEYGTKRLTNLSDSELEATALYKIVMKFYEASAEKALNALKMYMGDGRYKQDRKAVGNKLLRYVKDAIQEMEDDIRHEHTYSIADSEDED